MKSLEEKLLAAFEVEHREHLDTARLLLDAAGNGGAPDLIELHRRLHSLKGAARAVDMRPVEALAHALEGLIEDCQSGALELEDHSTDVVRDALDAIEDWVGAALAREKPPAIDAITRDVEERRSGKRRSDAQRARAEPVPDASPKAPRTETTRIETRDFDAMLQSSSEILASLSFQSRLETELHALQMEARGLEHDLAARRKVERRGGDAAFDAQRANGSLVRLQQFMRRLDSANREQRAHSWRMRQLGARLRSQVELLRMVSADTVFAGVGKIVRDIARDQGKAARVTVKGLDTLADRAVLQSLKDPVLHLLRNAINHGIETPAERARNGKSGEGAILFEVSAHAGELRLVVEDDGAGIAVSRVLEVAKGRGLLARDAAPEGAALTALLAQPGFSTAERVTEVAGRGMGLSVVKETLAKLGGALTIAGREPCGVRVLLTAPVSSLASRFVLLSAGGDIWCLPANRVERIHRVRADDIETLEGRPHFVAKGEVPMALAPLAFLLGDAGAPLSSGGGILTVAELQGESRFGVVIDEIVGVRDGVMRDYGPDTQAGGVIAGGVLLDAGVVAPVLDAASLAAAYGRAEARCQLSRKDEKAARPRSVLVVDDSITTRTLEKSILEASGFDVRLSVDGADALRQLRQRQTDLVISDVEMPTLDGFGLIRAMKQDSALRKIPVILVTSRSDDTDRRRGLDLGADAYVVKQRFDQTELLSIIDRLI